MAACHVKDPGVTVAVESITKQEQAVATRYGRVLGVLLLRQGVSKQLAQLENRLSDGEVAQFRWWTWATWYKRRRVRSSTLLFLLAARTDSPPVSQQLDNTALVSSLHGLTASLAAAR